MSALPPRAGPLAGIRILEVSHFLAGPYAGLLLADLGADVIKLEPATGDLSRQVGPHAVGPHNVYFASLNRNKRSVCLDLESREGRAHLGALAATAHGLVTNLRPAAIRKLGLTYEALRDSNERLACLALTGYGLDGPYSDLPAYDYVVQALAGVMHLTGEPDAPPTRVGYSVVDNTAGMMGALALVSRILEGRGGQVEVSLYDVLLSQMNYLAGAWLNAGERPSRQPSGGHPYFVPAQVFATRDGHLALFITHDRFWRRFAEEVGRPAWADDPRFATMAARLAHRAEVVEQVGALLGGADTAHWVERLAHHGIVAAPVRTLEESLQSELTRTRNMVVTMQAGDAPIRAVGNPIKTAGHRPGYHRPPLLGEHTAEVLDALPPPRRTPAGRCTRARTRRSSP